MNCLTCFGLEPALEVTGRCSPGLCSSSCKRPLEGVPASEPPAGRMKDECYCSHLAGTTLTMTAGHGRAGACARGVLKGQQAPQPERQGLKSCGS